MAIESQICDFGWKAKEFNLLSVDNKYYSLETLKGKNGTLIMFICNHCPYVKAISNKISFEAEELNKLGINSVAIMSNDIVEYPDDSFEKMKIFSNQNKFNFPYLFDESQEVAKNYDAKCTPDFFGFNYNLELQYRGRLDSSGSNKTEKKLNRELYNAMLLISETNNGPTDQIPSIGCSIKWKNIS